MNEVSFDEISMPDQQHNKKSLCTSEILLFVPKDVDLSTKLLGTFGKAEVEYAAVHLIEYLQEICAIKWTFTFSGLYEYYLRNKLNTNEILFGLLGSWFDDGSFSFQEDNQYIINWGNGFQVTEKFLQRIVKHVR